MLEGSMAKADARLDRRKRASALCKRWEEEQNAGSRCKDEHVFQSFFECLADHIRVGLYVLLSWVPEEMMMYHFFISRPFKARSMEGGGWCVCVRACL